MEDLLDQVDGRRFASSWKNDDIFIPAVLHQNIFFRQAGGDRLSDLLQHLGPQKMSMTVHHLFKIINIHKDHGQSTIRG